jgi:hypothetical protein
MKTATLKTWPVGPTAASLFVAYMLVLQSLVLGLVTKPGSLRAGVFAGGVCLNDGKAQTADGDPAAPGPRRGHAGDQCCVFHCSGAGIPPTSAFDEVPVRAFHAQRAWAGAAMVSFSPWPTLPVGSRAPPTAIL